MAMARVIVHHSGEIRLWLADAQLGKSTVMIEWALSITERGTSSALFHTMPLNNLFPSHTMTYSTRPYPADALPLWIHNGAFARRLLKLIGK